MQCSEFHQPKRCITILVAYVRDCILFLCAVISIMSEVVTPRSTKLFNYRKKGCHELWKAGIPLKIIREQPVWVSLVQGAVHHEDRDALPLGHGLKMLQLEGTVEGWSSSTPNRDDE